MTTAPLDDLAALLAPLHAPFTCKSLKAPNRFCMAPMSRYFAPGGVLTDDGAEYYRRRAAAGIGTIITEGTGVAIDHTVAATLGPDLPLHVVHNGLGHAFRAGGQESPHPTIVAVGRLVPMKGFHVLLDAVASLRDRGVRVHCTIIGDGPERQRLLRQRSALGLDGQVELTGALPQSAVKRHMATATLLVMPCIVTRQGSADGIPNVLMEAMASGLPVISTTISGIPELVEDGLNGRLIEPGDPELLGDAIVELLADAARQERFASAGRHKVEREFNIRVEAGRLLDHFGKACNA